jgi:hypothetical protein
MLTQKKIVQIVARCVQTSTSFADISEESRVLHLLDVVESAPFEVAGVQAMGEE